MLRKNSGKYLFCHVDKNYSDVFGRKKDWKAFPGFFLVKKNVKWRGPIITGEMAESKALLLSCPKKIQ